MLVTVKIENAGLNRSQLKIIEGIENEISYRPLRDLLGAYHEDG